MKKIYTIILCFMALTLCVSCLGEMASPATEFTNIVYQPRHATGFLIAEDEAHNRLLRVTRPWQGEELKEQTLAIFNSAEEAQGYKGQYIVGPAKRVVCMSTSHVAMLDAVGCVDAIVGLSGKDYVMNETIAQRTEVLDVGYDSNLDYEALLSLHPDVVLMYGITAENSAQTAKLRELNIPYIYLGDYTEQSPLGKAEWVVAVAEIVGVQEAGIATFSEVEQRYLEVKGSISTEGRRPKVMLNTPYQDVWYMPSDDSYMVQLIEDAGGEYIYKGNNPTGGSRGIGLEEALTLVGSADIWLNPSQCLTLEELRRSVPHFANCGVVERGDVYNNNHRRSPKGGSDFWESAIVRPDRVLSDLKIIMEGGEDELYYHHRLR